MDKQQGPLMTTVFDAYRDVVRPEWIDNNNHLNMGYYLVVFDEATGAFLAAMGLTPKHRREHATGEPGHAPQGR